MKTSREISPQLGGRDGLITLTKSTHAWINAVFLLSLFFSGRTTKKCIVCCFPNAKLVRRSILIRSVVNMNSYTVNYPKYPFFPVLKLGIVPIFTEWK